MLSLRRKHQNDPDRSAPLDLFVAIAANASIGCGEPGAHPFALSNVMSAGRTMHGTVTLVAHSFGAKPSDWHSVENSLMDGIITPVDALMPSEVCAVTWKRVEPHRTSAIRV